MGIRACMVEEKLLLDAIAIESGALMICIDSTEKITVVVGFYFVDDILIKKEL